MDDMIDCLLNPSVALPCVPPAGIVAVGVRVRAGWRGKNLPLRPAFSADLDGNGNDEIVAGYRGQGTSLFIYHAKDDQGSA